MPSRPVAVDVLVYEYREEEERVVVVTVQDARSSTAVTHS
jgi:hypothetical protein